MSQLQKYTVSVNLCTVHVQATTALNAVYAALDKFGFTVTKILPTDNDIWKSEGFIAECVDAAPGEKVYTQLNCVVWKGK